MRGKVHRNRLDTDHARITPAYAGKSVPELHRSRWKGDHPRLCGEKSEKELIAKTAEGSPPPMRGKVHIYIENIQSFRITPAYAGKSVKTNRRCRYSKDHPRLCGEK